MKKNKATVTSITGSAPAFLRAVTRAAIGKAAVPSRAGFRSLVLVAAVAAGILAFAGCGKKESKAKAPPVPETPQAAAAAPTSPAAAPVNAEAPRDVQEKQLVAQAVAMREGKAPPPPSMELRGGELATPEVLAAYNQRLAQIMFQRREGPENLEELVRKWPMPRLPTPLAGKRIVYDARYRIIKLDPP
ncbi:MAG: hypothetical protein WCL11_03725 [Verrucomicrobiota bacterium]